MDILGQICISHWFPKLLEAGVRVPETEILPTDCDLIAILDGEKPEGYDDFMYSLGQSICNLGLPAFLRTGHSAFKHYWKHTCFVTHESVLSRHVATMVEHSNLGMPPLPTNVWAVRELLELEVEGSFRAFKGIPIGKEIRAFFRQGEIFCMHPYWPPGAIMDARDEEWQRKLDELNHISLEDRVAVETIVHAIIPWFMDGPGWSVDLCLDKQGEWWVTDMALAGVSYHWDTCEHVKMFDQELRV